MFFLICIGHNKDIVISFSYFYVSNYAIIIAKMVYYLQLGRFMKERKEKKYYVHPIDALDPGLDQSEVKNRNGTKEQ